MKHRSQWLAGLAAVALALITTATAFGYSGEVAGAVTVAGPGGTLTCGVNITVTATVVDAAGKLIAGQPVAWSFTSTPSTADKINTTPTITNASGVATTTVVLACVAGNRTIRAVADAISASAVLGVTAAGLPNTSTLPGETPAQNLPVIGTLLAVLAMAAGGVLALRRISTSRG
jgi:Bacterial Ig-like domain (group 1)